MKKQATKIKNPKVYRALISIILAIVIIFGIYFYLIKEGRIQIDDSIISAPIATISPNSPGKLMELDVYEGQMIKKGDTLAIVGTDTLRATTDGLVILANNQIGGNVTTQTQLIQIIDPGNMRVAGTIDENKGLNEIRVGQIASFTVDAFPGRKFWGYVDEISPSAKQTSLSFSISSERPTQQFQVFVKFNATKYPGIKNGMSAKMTVYTKTQ
jgi:multidrug resistance efflux pump